MSITLKWDYSSPNSLHNFPFQASDILNDVGLCRGSSASFNTLNFNTTKAIRCL